MAAYPRLSEIPFDSLDRLYDWCNIRYFRGELPSAVVEWSERLQKTFAFFEWKYDGERYSPNITLSCRLKGAFSELLDTMVHEMIHVWQYHQYLSTKQTKYLDMYPEPGHSFHSSWHGRFFYEQADRLNHQFPELSLAAVREGYPSDLGLKGQKRYCLHITFRNGNQFDEALFRSTYDYRSQIDRLLSQILDLYGVDAVLRVSYFTSSMPDVDLFPSLTKAMKFRSNQSPCAHCSVLIDRILSHRASEPAEVVYENNVTVTDQPALLDRVSPDAISKSFPEFFLHLQQRDHTMNTTDGCGEREGLMLAKAYQSWLGLPIMSALQTVQGRDYLKTLLVHATEKRHSMSELLRKLWFDLGPSRYPITDVVKALLRGDAFEDECKRMFVDSVPLKSQIAGLQVDCFLSSFHSVKKAVIGSGKRLTDDQLKAYMMHFGVPIQDPHIVILRKIMTDALEESQVYSC